MVRRLHDHAARDDRGVTMVELLVVMVLLSIVLTITMSAFQASSRVFNATNDDATGLAEARKVSERMGRDIRNARGIDVGATSSKLVVWIDANSDYRRQASESITWELEPNGDGEHFDVIRREGTTEQIIEARSLVSQIAFTYDVAAPETTLVQAEVTYDAFVGVGAQERTLYFVERLRNADDVT
jgi:prepilin-type N-terminal cleavage/methylation domain-containing protein